MMFVPKQHHVHACVPHKSINHKISYWHSVEDRGRSRNFKGGGGGGGGGRGGEGGAIHTA